MKYSNLALALIAAIGLGACEKTVVTPPVSSSPPPPVVVPGPPGPPGPQGATGPEGAPGQPGGAVVIVPPPERTPSDEPPKQY